MKNLELKCWCLFLAGMLLLASPFFLAGCKSTLPTEKETATITIKETLHDTTFIEVPDSSAVKALIECQNGKPVIKQIVQAKPGRKLRPPNLNLKDNIIECDCYADSLKLYAFWKSKNVESATVKQKPVLVEKQLTWWQKTWMAFGKIFTVVVVLLTVYKLFKNRLNPI